MRTIDRSSAFKRDHDLPGDWALYRECHVMPDLLLIYRELDSDTLRLALARQGLPQPCH